MELEATPFLRICSQLQAWRGELKREFNRFLLARNNANVEKDCNQVQQIKQHGDTMYHSLVSGFHALAFMDCFSWRLLSCHHLRLTKNKREQRKPSIMVAHLPGFVAEHNSITFQVSELLLDIGATI